MNKFCCCLFIWCLVLIAACSVPPTSAPLLPPATPVLRLEFMHPVEGAILNNGSLDFRVKPVPGAEGYAWQFIQNGNVLLDTLRDEQRLTEAEYHIPELTRVRKEFGPGRLQVQVRARVNGEWTEPSILTVQLSDTNTPKPVALPTIRITPAKNCANGWSRLSVGLYAHVLGAPTDPPNRVRSGPDKQAEVIAQLYPQSLLKVLDGPVCADGLVFWRVGHAAIPSGSGWTAEGNLQEYYLEPYVPLSEPITLSAYGINFTVPGEWSSVPEAQIVPAGDDGMGRTWPEYTRITLTVYPAQSEWAPEIYVYRTTELTATFFGPTAGAPIMVRAHTKTMPFGFRWIVENGNAHPVFNSRITYYYQGTSSDGVYTFIVVMPVNAPFLPESYSDQSLPSGGIPFTGMENWNYKDWDVYYGQVQQQLEQYPETDFTPSLALLDELVASLKVALP